MTSPELPQQFDTPVASTSSNKRACIESPSSSHLGSSHTQQEYEQALQDLVDERAQHSQTKAALESKSCLIAKAKFS